MSTDPTPPPILDYQGPSLHTRRAVGGLRIISASSIIIGCLPFAIVSISRGHSIQPQVAAIFCIAITLGIIKLALSWPIARANRPAAITALTFILLELLPMGFLAITILLDRWEDVLHKILLSIAPLAWLAVAWELIQSLRTQRTTQ